MERADGFGYRDDPGRGGSAGCRCASKSDRKLTGGVEAHTAYVRSPPLGDYLRRADRPRQSPNIPALFLSPAGTRLLYTNVQNTFQRLVGDAGIMPRSAACRPRQTGPRPSI